MDDADHVCPLCCEELDLSDREFYPCKCGYQVCMWCWHRIRESESGLCPACRTPYGEDPHQFSAVDVEDVLKANKARDAALKRQKQQEGGLLSGSQHDGAPNSVLNEDGTNAAMEVPKDRSQLANMRVIRRNLVYAVGLPASIASEDMLRRPEYFGQYGKIAKIVINRAISGDAGRRSSASAYVTFAHKEDTLACILGLDGFYFDNRNIRASYGTSKYCSAFIKSVRCNNPECTYLHEMGAAEDTFTKQEIQAGYVTSGRDVLARQQQIVSEQLRQNSTGTVPRKRVGGGGPSGTGRASSSPVFPPPEYDEPPKPSPVLLPPPSGGVTRAATSGSFSLNPSNISAKLGRSSSVGNRSPTLGATAGPASSAVVVPRANKSAAAIVAGVHSVKVEDSSLHSTLTPLTPLKRAPKTTKSTSSAGASDDSKLPSMRVGKTKGNGIRNGVFGGTVGSSLANEEGELPPGPSSIGGDVIGVGSLQAVLLPGSVQLAGPSGLPVAEGGLSSALGGEVFTGPLSNKPISRSTTVDKWNSNQIPGAPVYSAASDLWSGMNSGSANGNSSSALASILGVDLPTGSGSLRENSNIWPSSNLNGPSSLSAFHSNSSVGATPGNVIGGIPMNMNSTSLIGGVPIGGGLMGGQGHVGGLMGAPSPVGSGYGGKSDIALLQSLLPGVHITSGSEGLNTGGINGWNQGGPSALGGESLLGWNNGAAPSQRSSVGAIGQTNGSQTQRQGQIW